MSGLPEFRCSVCHDPEPYCRRIDVRQGAFEHVHWFKANVTKCCESSYIEDRCQYCDGCGIVEQDDNDWWECLDCSGHGWVEMEVLDEFLEHV